MTIEEGPEIIEVDAAGNIIDIDDAKKGRGRLSAVERTEGEYSAEFLAECADYGIDRWAIEDGGDYRQSENRTIFWIPLEQLLEWEKADSNIKDNDEFWSWVREFIKEHQFQTKAERTKTEQKSWSSWSSGIDYSGWKNKASKWWNDYGGYSSYSGDSALTKKLAVALRAINTTVQVVNDTGKRFRVSLASEDSASAPMSYTSFSDLEVVVSPQALLDTSIEQDYGIEVTTGYGLHEASHVKYTTPLVDTILKPTKLTPMTVSSFLSNIAEDVRIEELTSEKFPGFTEYFATMKAYLWNVTKDKKPDKWGPDLDSKLNSVLSIVRWPVEYADTCANDPELDAEFAWWNAWRDDYIAGKDNLRMSVIRGLDHLKLEEDTKKELEELEKKEQAAADAAGRNVMQMTDEEFKEFLDKLRKELMEGVSDPCPSPSQPGSEVEIQLTAAQGQELDKLLREQYTEQESHFQMWEGGAVTEGPLIQVSKPDETHRSKNVYEKPGRMVERFRSMFFFRKKTPSERERLLKQGFIDEDELWRAGAGDVRVFERTTQIEEQPTSITLLVDVSGSMAGRGVQRAQALANTFLACLRTQRGVRVRIRAHTTGSDGKSYGETCAIYRVWEQGDPDTRIGLITALPHASNFDGFAIEWCLQELEREARPNEQKVLIVLSDGLPAGRSAKLSYSGDSAMRHMRFVTDKFERMHDTITIQIAIDPDGLNPTEQAIMFKHWVPYESDQGLLRDMTKLLSRIFGGVE